MSGTLKLPSISACDIHIFEIISDKKFGAWKPEEGADDFGLYDFDMGIIDPHGSPNYDYGKPGDAGDEVDKSKRGTISPEM